MYDAVQALIGASPPSRGAWIEMNIWDSLGPTTISRPPRGGRGLKYLMVMDFDLQEDVAPLAGGVD